jgi:hypothetical protein
VTEPAGGGYVLGRMLLAGQISEDQHDPGLRYAEHLSRWFRLLLGRFPSILARPRSARSDTEFTILSIRAHPHVMEM